MQLKLALEGKLQEYMDKEYELGAEAVTNGIKEATNGLKQSMRSQVLSAGMNSRLANSWRGDTYPKAKKVSMQPVLFIQKLPKLWRDLSLELLSGRKMAFGWQYRHRQLRKKSMANE